MPALSQKNMMLSPAGIDLGLGAALQTSVEDAVADNKKKLKLKQMQDQRMSPAGMSLLMNPLGNANG